MALQPLKISNIQQSQPITRDAQGHAALWFVTALNNTFKAIKDAINGVIDAQNAAEAAQAAAETAQTTGEAAQGTADTAVTDASTAQARADSAYTLASNAVVKNTTPAPVYSAYGGQSISNPPTQAQVQALDTAVVSLSAAVASVIAKLESADVFS